ncbi:MAG: N-acetylmuramoyl-L-alanine amidase [Clostridia bacterium]|nr:N-acetylmuramoyl-L-alanine amidase [Clostridia bacterium]
MNEHKYVVINARSSSAVATSLALCICMALTVYLSFSGRTVSSTYTSAGTVQVIIDPGHGGMDGGTKAADGTLEKDINLDISLKLNEIMEADGIRTVLTRKDDNIDYGNSKSVYEKKRYDINSRMKYINENPQSVFISIHQNYFDESKYSGAQVFYSGNNEKSEKLASCIQQSIISRVQPENTRQIKKIGTEIYLLNNAQIPAVMVECGFLSNENEAALLNDNNYRMKIAQAIYEGLKDYMK